MLQYFNTDWTEITGKMPELEKGLPALAAASPSSTVGRLRFGGDPFDIGSKNQRNTVRITRTEAELQELVKNGGTASEYESILTTS